MRRYPATAALLFGATSLAGCALSSAGGRPPPCLSAPACLTDGVAALLDGAAAEAEAPLRAACRLDLDDACLILGLSQLRQGDPLHRQAATELLEPLAAAGHPEAREAWVSLRGERGAGTVEQARATLTALCETTPPFGCATLARTLADGAAPDRRAGQLLLELGCLGHDADACVELGDWHQRRLVEPHRSPVAAWLAGCWAGAPGGCSRAGWALTSDEPASADQVHGLALLVHGCSEGDGAGCAWTVTLAAATDQLDDLPEELPAAIARACERGDGAACAAGAELSLFDPVTRPALDEVLPLARRACELGDRAACLRVGLLARAGLVALEPDVWLAHAGALAPTGDDDASALDPLAALAEEEGEASTEELWRRAWRAVAPLPPWAGPPLPSPRWPRAFHREACALGHASSCARVGPIEARHVAEQRCEHGELAACLAAAAAQPAPGDLAAEERPELPFWQRACAARHGPSCWRLAETLREAESADARTAADEATERACALEVDEACQALEAGRRPP